MINEKMREDFEEWLDSSSEFQLGGERAAYYWIAWQASRAALCVELPKIVNSEWACTSDECSAMRDAIRFCSRAIESTGVRVK